MVHLTSRPNKFGVTASIPCFRANRYVRKAVESLLSQTHSDLTVVVVNDGQDNPPWAELAHIRDPRLVRFSLERNRGPYFVHQVVLAASDTPYFLIQDADDWSAAHRVRTLLSQLLADNADFAFSARQQYRQDHNGTLRLDSLRWHRKDTRPTSNSLLPRPLTTAGQGRTQMISPHGSLFFDPILTNEFVNRASHHGVFLRTALEQIGGYYGGFRLNYDTLLTNLLLMTGKVTFVDAPLYHYLIRRDSLSHSDATGARSLARAHARAQQAGIYNEALHWFRKWKKHAINREEFMTIIRGLTNRFVTASDHAAIALEAARLTAVMRTCSKL